ncbi:phthiocerol/phthiodiolone dimycocerosyl transferase family protein [Micromonospora sp. WMMD754]|uniref:phthiocerol/phthiodiolone dimycocerosyl transferase family protein n=1 Tax=unclassified Micromonospora TaxID=2617518 RepID=UPI0012FD3E9C|nr:peptide synthetase [Micromonospora sp. WMMA2032]
MRHSPAHPIVRPLGAFEHIIDLYIGRNPVQFSLVVELASPVSAHQLERALAQLQRTHPLLAVGIDRSGDRPTFRKSTEPIEVRHVGGSWRDVAAQEQARPVDADGSPLARATLVGGAPGDRGSAVVLTFSHQITDGRGALRAAHDLLVILDGRTLPARPAPLDQESLLERLPRTERPTDHIPGPPAEPAVGTIRPFDATAPSIEIAELDPATTAHLRSTARANGSTVQGAICAAAAQALAALTGAESIRVNVPIDLRSALGLEDDVVNRFTATSVVLRAPAQNTLWSLAKDATAQLRVARDGARHAALMLGSLNPADASEAEAAMLAATAADLEITNLGTSEPDTSSAVAIWGPTMTTQVRDERILGVVTHAGSLRLVLTTHGDTRGLPADVAGRLTRLGGSAAEG